MSRTNRFNWQLEFYLSPSVVPSSFVFLLNLTHVGIFKPIFSSPAQAVYELRIWWRAKIKRNSPISFIFAKIRWRLTTKFPSSAREFQISNFKFRCHLGKISYSTEARFRFAEISPERKFALAKFRRNKNSLLPPLSLFFWIAFMWVKCTRCLGTLKQIHHKWCKGIDYTRAIKGECVLG